MGTNYYAFTFHPLDGPGQSPRTLHIGKSSFGWCFSLRGYRELGLNSLETWIPVLHSDVTEIRDEYGASIPFVEMIGIIVDRHGRDEMDSLKIPKRDLEQFLAANSAVMGPKNLLRSDPKSPYRKPGEIVHGPGTWDVCFYEFF
jgi:hypothetical protein